MVVPCSTRLCEKGFPFGPFSILRGLRKGGSWIIVRPHALLPEYLDVLKFKEVLFKFWSSYRDDDLGDL